MTAKRADALVVFTPSGKRARFPLGTPLLQAARQLGVDVDSVCGGRGICGRCKVLLSEGEFAKYGIRSTPDHLSPLSEPEQRFAKKRELEEGCRLSCHTHLAGDVVIDVPAASQVHHQVVRKSYEARDIQVNPVVHLYYVEVQEPRLEEPSGDLERLLAALEKEWGLANLECDFRLLGSLQATLRAGGWCVTVAVREGREVVAIWPGFKGRIFGVATDVGSTTIAAHLCDLASGEVLASAGIMNPQIRFGEDLMSRVSYVMLNPGGEAEMTRVVREGVNQLIENLVAEAEISEQDILELTFVGNPIMHHLLLGISPVMLGTAPFALATDEAVGARAADLDLRVHPGA
ncbi:MAG: 2Fe-2S iron-sulfur cluster-binding protein, partial [Myxococcales bacterium]|nr:2Fe-2S iron-sulfur cluster-binding protein [Myxococcales bacterium]